MGLRALDTALELIDTFDAETRARLTTIRNFVAYARGDIETATRLIEADAETSKMVIDELRAMVERAHADARGEG